MGCLWFFIDVVLFFVPMVVAWRMQMDVFAAGVWGTGVYTILQVLATSFYMTAMKHLPVRTRVGVFDFSSGKRQSNSFRASVCTWVARAYVVIYVLQMLQ